MPKHRPGAPLTDKEQAFVEEYLVDLNATQAAIRAKYSEKTAAVIGQENLQKPYIKAAIDAAKLERSKRTGITADRVVLELARIGLADLRKAVEWGPGRVILKDSATLDDDTAAAITSVSMKESGEITIKLEGKTGALSLLGKHLPGFFAPEKIEATVETRRDYGAEARERRRARVRAR